MRLIISLIDRQNSSASFARPFLSIVSAVLIMAGKALRNSWLA
jgi:hypothetical protein